MLLYLETVSGCKTEARRNGQNGDFVGGRLQNRDEQRRTLPFRPETRRKKFFSGRAERRRKAPSSLTGCRLGRGQHSGPIPCPESAVPVGAWRAASVPGRYAAAVPLHRIAAARARLACFRAVWAALGVGRPIICPAAVWTLKGPLKCK